MAIVSENLATKMVTRLNFGMVDGKEVIKNKTYNDLRADASVDAILTVGTAITGLQVPALEEVHRIQEDLIYDNGL
jgi:hypothetical protein